MEEFKALGISFHNTPLDLREKVALEEGEARELTLKLREVLGLSESLIVSTCNRTEIYYAAGQSLQDEILSLLAVQKGIDKQLFSDYFISYGNEEAIEHLFRVSLGLDSQVLGDIQIANQIKRAYQLSADLEMSGPFLHRMMHTIFYANKRVVQETRLQDGNASVASVAVELIKGFTEHITDPRIVLVGLGEIGQNVLENLKSVDASVCLINRTRSKAEQLAESANATVASFSELDKVIDNSDVIISAVTAKEPVIQASHLDQEKLHHKLFIDLSVPRSISEDLSETRGVAIYNVDQLSQKTEKARTIREKAIPDAELIVKEAMAGFDQWKAEMEVSPTINKLKKVLDQIRQEELLRHSSKVSDEEMKLLDVVTKNMIQKVIKLPVLQLKAACKRGDSGSLVDVLHDLFDLDPDEVKKGQ